jgi:hypothetical protein
MRRFLFAVVLAGAAAAAACGGVTDPSQNTTDKPASQALPAGNNNYVVFPFNAANRGEVSITVTSLAPNVPSNTYFVVGLGQQVSGQCSPITANQFSVVGTAGISGYSVTPGAYCAYVQDEGYFTVTETVTIQISHP